MNTKRRMRMLALVVAACLVVGRAVDVRGEEKSADRQTAKLTSSDMVCGPRCVQFLLRHYGCDNDVDLIDLTRETQWPNFEAGASLAALEQALQKRGVYTSALRIDPRDRIRWPNPVLVHLKGKSAIGHYVVWLSSEEDKARVWTGLAGTKWGEVDRLAERRSGAILLTSSEPIANPETAVYRPIRVWPWAIVIVGFLMLVAVLQPGAYRPLRRLVLGLIGKNDKQAADVLDVTVRRSEIPQ